jgi:hypothetical protein
MLDLKGLIPSFGLCRFSYMDIFLLNPRFEICILSGFLFDALNPENFLKLWIRGLKEQ